jgi:glycosyltransferase involved in cell wall biosynthesis
MKIGYDARLSIGQYRGMGQFLRRLIAGREQNFVGFCASGESDTSLNLVSSGHRFYPLWEQVSLPKLIASQGIDIFLAPYNTAPLRLPGHVKLVLVIHDLIYLEPLPLSTSFYQNLGRFYRRMIVPKAVERADVIVTVSRYTGEQLVSDLGVPREKICAIPNSVDEEWFTRSEGLRETKGYILMVSGEAPSKNLKMGIAGFADYATRTCDSRRRLKIAGVKAKYHPAFRAAADSLGVAGQVDFLGYITQPEMRDLYLGAELFVMPSLKEGFGIPVLEAMASGVPVALSNTSCLPEIGGAAARYFDPLSPEEMGSTMQEVLGSRELQQSMSQQGKQQAGRFCSRLVNEKIEQFWDSMISNVQPEAE